MAIRSMTGQYTGLSALRRKGGETQREVVSGPLENIAILKQNIEKERERNKARLQLIGSLTQLGRTAESNLERRRFMEKGAEILGEPMERRGGIRGFLDTLKTAAFGPRQGSLRIDGRDITPQGLEFIGAGAVEHPGRVDVFSEIAQKYFSSAAPVRPDIPLVEATPEVLDFL